MVRNALIRSRAEIRAIVLKAARGAGLDPGLAEDLAQASGWIGPDRLGDLAAMLKGAPGIALCAAATLDAREAGGAERRDDRVPVWLMQAMAAARRPDAAPPPRVAEPVPDAGWRALDALATLTLVPSSEASRAAGAGAGLSDND